MQEVVVGEVDEVLLAEEVGPSPLVVWGKRIFVSVLVVWQLLLSTLLLLAGLEDPLLWALACMMWGVNLLWILTVGFISILARKHVQHYGTNAPRFLRTKFFFACTSLVLIEEAITVAMTNCAPMFGVEFGEMYITASGNYLDVVLFHSVIVFLPQFAAWAWLLHRYSFTPFSTFLLYGLTGWVNETLFAGPNLLALAQWILVYGLLVYLPAFLFRGKKDRKRPGCLLFFVALLLPILASIPMVLLLWFVITPGHPSIHFDPIGEFGVSE